MMRIAIACDHAGFELKEKIKPFLSKLGHSVRDLGAFSAESVDYPLYARKVAGYVSSGKVQRGVLICGSGIGMCMAANKIKKVRAAACETTVTAKLSRSHNDSNVLCLGSRLLTVTKALSILSVWLKTPFEGGRHQRRVRMIG